MPDKITEDKPKAEKASAGTCGFENKQYFSDSGKKMTCTLPKGHEGDHSAPVPEEGADEEVRVAFSDAAGAPLEAGELKKLEAAKAKREEAKKAAEKK
jgi:hypothetical protein